jgi:hypothetical protein
MRYYFDIRDDFLAVSDGDVSEYASLEGATKEAIVTGDLDSQGRIHCKGIAGDRNRKKPGRAIIRNGRNTRPERVWSKQSKKDARSLPNGHEQ